MTKAYSPFAMRLMPEDPMDYMRIVTFVHVPEILVSLRDGPLCNRQIAIESMMDESLCRKILAYLTDVGLVRAGARKTYCLTPNGSKFADIMFELVVESRTICLLNEPPAVVKYPGEAVI